MAKANPRKSTQSEGPDLSPVNPWNQRDWTFMVAWAETFKDIIRQYLDLSAGMNANFQPTDRYCFFCVRRGIHGTKDGCDCICHRAREFLAEYEESKADALNERIPPIT